ncbi:hypothetical protein [Streptococcus iners]|uniref:Uncharacterized protein n=1 Tax=Streptococcus iners TaxID=3028084 RepID=A0AA96VMU1_9STRE|nr:hypothetical protein [Streptococcus sp. 29887]MCK3880847.1 hypothetical protein [Streptococcus suis]MCK4025020.1 hypothetical protein [Streptococcus suis]WNY50903.1 hypothetical protein PW252_10065 [Streptococcus sp. 29887]
MQKVERANLLPTRAENPYSKHIFILPFVISNDKGLEPQANVWGKISDMKDLPYLEEDRYCYAYEKFLNQEVHDAIRDYSRTYRYKGGERYYQVHCYRKEEDSSVAENDTHIQSYQLDINYILMRLIQDDAKDDTDSRIPARTGFLIIAADNYYYEDLESIRAINQYGRRIYDPFLTPVLYYRESPYDITLSDQSLTEVTSPIAEPRDDFSVGKVKVKSAIKDLFHSFFGQNILLFPQGFREKNDKQLLEINRILDDRMFVLSDYQLEKSDFDELSLAIRETSDPQFQKFCQASDGDGQLELVYNQQKRLYSYIYIDNGDSTCQSARAIVPLLQRSIYDRWLDYGTIYGVTQHSMIMLTTKGVPDFLLTYFYTEYLEMILFVLTQRVRILSFSSDAGERAKNSENTDAILQLQKRYVIFKNQFLLPELSSQEQAVELYQMMQENFFILSQKEILDDQITSLYEISQAESAVEEKKRDEKLNNVVLALTIFTIFTALGDFESSINVILSGVFEVSGVQDLTKVGLFGLSGSLLVKIVVVFLYILCIVRLIKASEVSYDYPKIFRDMLAYIFGWKRGKK